MKCPKCQSENRAGAHFCGSCGEKLSKDCPHCGTGNPPENVFCDKCGCDLGSRREAPAIDFSRPCSYTPRSLAEKILTTRNTIVGERKVVTVLFADVANFTSISEGLDPEQVHRLMGGCFRILLDEVHRYEGTIDKFTGDGVMALFGAPVAYEDHAQRGCYAALAVRKTLREYGQKIKEDLGFEFQVRVGLNSGTVIVGSVGDDLKLDYTAIGDTTNLAARMQTLAQPDTILVTDHTQRLARDFFEFEPLGKLAVRGKASPQETYELVRASAVETRIQAEAAKGLTPFVGRTKEREALKEAFDLARSGSGQVIGITGDAGVGKSRLLLEFRNVLPGGEHTYLEGRCLHYGESMVYLPILDMLRSYFGIQEGDAEEEVRKKVGERLGRLDGAPPGSLAPLEDVLSLKVEDPVYLQIEPQQRRQRIFEFLRDLLIRVSNEKPLVLALEDLHWIDKNSQDFLDFLAGGLSQTSILLMLLYRPEYRYTQASRTYCREIPLEQLSERRSAELVQGILEGGEVAAEISDLVLSRAGGNPLFVEELTRSLLENGAILQVDHRYALTREVSALEVPDTIQGIIAARMDRLGADLKRIMQAASVIGTEFGCRILENVTGMKEQIKASLLHLQGLEFINENRMAPEPEYAFKHALTQEVAYNSLLTHLRREIHEKIGDAIEELYAGRLEEYYELLAYHYVRSDDTAKAVEYLDLASQKAARANAPEHAKRYFEKAMELLDTLPDTEENRERRISLLVNLSNVFFMLMKLREYHDLLVRYRSLADQLDNSGLLGAFYARAGTYEGTFGLFDQAIQTLTKARTLCEAAGNTEDAGLALVSLAMSHLVRSDYDRVFELKEDILRATEQKFTLRCYVRGLSSCASQAYAHLGRWDEAIEAGQRALSAAQEFSDDSLIASAATDLSAVYTHQRDLEQAIKYAERALERAPTPVDKTRAQIFLAWALCHSGEPHRGIALLVGIVPVLKAARIVVFELWCTLYLAEGYWLAGEYDKGRQTAEDLLEIADRCGARFHIGYAYYLLGEVALKTNPEEAAPHFEKAIEIFREIKAENELALAYSGMGRLYKLRGEYVESRRYLTQALEIFERLGTLLEPEKVRRELAELPR